MDQMDSSSEERDSDEAFAAMEAEQAREYELTGVTDEDGMVFDPAALADDSESAGLDDTDPQATSLI